MQLKIQWGKKDLIRLVDSRLSEVFRQEYTGATPTLHDLLPAITKKYKIDPLDYMLDRTFFRPRDVIDFINTCLEQSEWKSKLTWSDIRQAETSYSDRRLQSVIDEWKDSYFGIHLVFNFLKKAKKIFSYTQFSDEDINQILSHSEIEQSSWLKDLQGKYIKSIFSLEDIKMEILKSLYFIGVIGVKFPHTHKVVYSFQQLQGVGTDAFLEYPIHVHKMFWGALGIDNDPNP